ncbi:MAG: M23 family metallopeptidase [Rickettsiales bacterium]|jgi:murein DD-endopeptidase MepM/ murein hydrolase activator NlpD|nr:M23 family metallopeptidase [Rickettsiales bacterium]
MSNGKVTRLYRDYFGEFQKEKILHWLPSMAILSLIFFLSVWSNYKKVLCSSQAVLRLREKEYPPGYGLATIEANGGYEIVKRKLGNGENLFDLLIYDMKFSRNGVILCLAHLKKVFDVKRLRAGQEISIKYKISGGVKDGGTSNSAELDLEELRILDNQNLVEIIVTRGPDGSYYPQKRAIGAAIYYDRFFVEIRNNLYSDAVFAGVPAEVIMELIGLYSFDIDFQRDIRRGDKLEIVFESKFMEVGGKTRNGSIIYANLNISGIDHKMYKFRHKGINNYFNENGLSIKKSLLKTPIDGARITSGFGARKHPILGYTKTHQGVDFAAPIGTPFYAAGNGVVTKIIFNCRGKDRHCGDGYGNYIVIRHNNLYSSEYAHISRIAKNVTVGSRVRQGDVIGFVGNTGMATGPHLHYGLIYRETRINPAKIRPMSYSRLEGSELADFLKERDRINNFKISDTASIVNDRAGDIGESKEQPVGNNNRFRSRWRKNTTPARRRGKRQSKPNYVYKKEDQ